MNVETQVHLTTLRGLLTFQLHELQADLNALQQGRARMLADTATTDVADRMDIAAADQASDISDATLERLRHELAQCESALQRLDEERYGDCIACGESIPWPRLFAQPTAERCAACQRSFERGVQGAGRA
jgi:RNA polymerase-binding protein DksA